MTLASLLVRPVTILTAGTRVDDFGDKQPDWTTPTTFDVLGWLAYSTGNEVLDGRNATTTYLSLTLPPATPINAQSRVLIEGRTYSVDAEPMAAWTPRGEHHIEVALVIVDG